MSVFNNFINLNKKCPICLEKTGEMFSLDCFHKVHLDCCLNLISFECPLCRKKINNFPDVVKEAIDKNIIKYKDQVEKEERDTILREINENYSSVVSNLPHLPTPQLEIISALTYLIDNGIPLRYIPEVVSVTFYTGQPRPQLGFFFGVIIDLITKKINDDLEGDYDEDDDDEDPFLEENITLENTMRNVRVRTL